MSDEMKGGGRPVDPDGARFGAESRAESRAEPRAGAKAEAKTEPAAPPPVEPATGIRRRALLAGAAGALSAALLAHLPLPSRLRALLSAPPSEGSAPGPGTPASALDAPPRPLAPHAPHAPLEPRPHAPAAPAAQAWPPVPDDPTKVQGPPISEVGARSPFEAPTRRLRVTSSASPLEALEGTITPSDLHFERHHGGVALIDPERYSLLIHGMVERPMVFTLDDLRRFPSTSRIHFLECSGNFRRNADEQVRPSEICGLTSQSEWTGVPLAALFREVRPLPEARWFLAEGSDAAVMTRSIPVEKAWDDAMIAYGQNGEPLRPAQGYPARLFLPGWEGNASVKWLRRIELADRPFMTREETSRYTEPIRGDRARQFSFVMDARSIITSPCYPATVQPGWIEFRGIAWSGRGRITRAEVSFDEGRRWHAAELQGPVLPKAHTRFRYLWNWDGREATVLSRAVDETGYVQPTVRQLVEARGVGTGGYHLNAITGWRLRSDGSVVFRREAWA